MEALVGSISWSWKGVFLAKPHEGDTRSKIIELARELTQTNSFNWLSYQDLSNRLDIRKASIHYHFPTKASLGVELVKDYRKRFAEWVTEILKTNPSAPVALNAYIDIFRKFICNSERVCPGGILSLEWNTLPEEMKKEAKCFFADHRKFLDQILREGRSSGSIQSVGTVEEQIAFVGSTIQGAIQFSRVFGSDTTFNMVMEQLRTAVMTRGNL